MVSSLPLDIHMFVEAGWGAGAPAAMGCCPGAENISANGFPNCNKSSDAFPACWHNKTDYHKIKLQNIQIFKKSTSNKQCHRWVINTCIHTNHNYSKLNCNSKLTYNTNINIWFS